MQKLSLVKPVRTTDWGARSALSERPKLGALAAEVIAQWSEVESVLALFLSTLLHANERAVSAMYTGLENRSAQLRMITSAVKAVLPDHHADIILILLAEIRSAMKFRDKLAHWCYGISDELPDVLLITEPVNKLAGLLESVRMQAEGKHPSEPVRFSNDQVYVIREDDLSRAIKNTTDIITALKYAISTVWIANNQGQRESNLILLSGLPPVAAVLDRRNQDRKNNPAMDPPESPPEINV